MLKKLKAYLRSDWWAIGDACQIFAGFVPIPETDDNEGLSTFISIFSGEVCPKSNVRDSATEVREKWTNCFHWYEEPASLKFKKWMVMTSGSGKCRRRMQSFGPWTKN